MKGNDSIKEKILHDKFFCKYAINQYINYIIVIDT